MVDNVGIFQVFLGVSPFPQCHSNTLLLTDIDIILFNAGEWTPGTLWTRRGEEKSPPFRHPGSNLGHAARSPAPCRLSHLAHCTLLEYYKFKWVKVPQLKDVDLSFETSLRTKLNQLLMDL